MTIPRAPNSTAEVVAARAKVLNSGTARNVQPEPKIDIIDIRHDAFEISLKDEILSSLRPQSGPKTMPTLLLYDEPGLQWFEEVNFSYQERAAGPLY